LIEMMGVMALSGIMLGGAITMFRTVRRNVVRTEALQRLEKIVEDRRLYKSQKDFSGISKASLIRDKIIDENEKIAGYNFRITVPEDAKSWSIIFDDMDYGDCRYFAAAKMPWAAGVAANNREVKDPEYAQCAESYKNKLEIIIK